MIDLYWKTGTIAIALALILFNRMERPALLWSKCGAPETPAQAIKRAAAVFSGEALGVKSDDKEERVEFRVERYWKGPQAKNLIVSNGSTDPDYRYRFKIGVKYLVYAYGPKLSTDKCARTKELSVASDDLKELGAGKEP